MVVDRHTVCYEVSNWRDDEVIDRHWEIEVDATSEELAEFADAGYLVREGLFAGQALERLRTPWINWRRANGSPTRPLLPGASAPGVGFRGI